MIRYNIISVTSTAESTNMHSSSLETTTIQSDTSDDTTTLNDLTDHSISTYSSISTSLFSTV
jgi:hypothetical protein